jgi:N-acetylmuramoyl-L-alanine amidase
MASELHRSISVKNDNRHHLGYLTSHGNWPLLSTFVLGCLSIVRASEPAAGSTADQRSTRAQQTVQIALSAEEIRDAEQRLSDLGYWTGPIDGVLDVGSRQALIAFQKVEDRARSGKLTRDELQLLRTAKRISPREIGYSHLEIDLSRQVLFAVEGSGLVSKILPVSTGNGKLFTSEGWTRRAITPCGRFTINHKIAGWRKSALGLLYYPNYIAGGIAIHGNPSVPVAPASHGCIRIPMFAAKEFSEINPIGTIVIVYYSEAVE